MNISPVRLVVVWRICHRTEVKVGWVDHGIIVVHISLILVEVCRIRDVAIVLTVATSMMASRHRDIVG